MDALGFGTYLLGTFRIFSSKLYVISFTYFLLIIAQYILNMPSIFGAYPVCFFEVYYHNWNRLRFIKKEMLHFEQRLGDAFDEAKGPFRYFLSSLVRLFISIYFIAFYMFRYIQVTASASSSSKKLDLFRPTTRL